LAEVVGQSLVVGVDLDGAHWGLHGAQVLRWFVVRVVLSFLERGFEQLLEIDEALL
jgi:hypothetical protein